MRARRSLRFAAWLITLLAGIGIGTAIGQQSPPMDMKGVDIKPMSTVDLAPDMPNYQLRARTITFEPDGKVGVHSHKDRPAFAYIKEGTLTELRDGGYVKEYKAGDIITESRDVTHSAENRTKSKVVIVGIDLIKKP